jgi:hypothetical protein
MKTLDGKVEYHIYIDSTTSIDLPTIAIPESHVKANTVTEIKIKKRKRKYDNKVNG